MRDNDLDLTEVLYLAAEGSILRTVAAAGAAFATKMTTTQVQARASGALASSTGLTAGHPNLAINSILEVLGSEASADSVAAVFTRGAKAVDVASLLTSKELASLPYHLQAGTSVWQLLQVENEVASKTSRTPYSYVDLTCAELLPV